MLKRLFLLLGVMAAWLSVQGEEGTCPLVHIMPERLPDLTMPRSGHSIFYANGELTLVGGHTTNFVPTPTAEYFAEGKWHQIPMAYCHDNGFSAALRTGEVIIGGGHEEPLGIGQTFFLERYNPQAHSFEGFGCLDRRRVLANATQLADGRVIISGNHYAPDAIACYDGRSQVQHLKDVAQGRCNPYILPIAKDNALIFSDNDLFNNHDGTILVDRLKGDPLHVPLLQQWRPLFTDQPFSSEAGSIGGYSYLIAATDSSSQLGIVMVRDTTFSLLPTVSPIPMECPFGRIAYKAPLVVDRQHQRGYIIGFDNLCRNQYVLAVDYARQPAAVTLYYTDSLNHSTIAVPIVTPDGDLILAGGSPDDNYKPYASVWLYHFATPAPEAVKASTGVVGLWIAIVAIILAVFSYIIYNRHRRDDVTACAGEVATDAGEVGVANGETSMQEDVMAAESGKTAELMERICQLMDEEQLYLHSDLKVQDVAVRLNTNSSYVSECINSVSSQSFSQFVNTFRVRHAQELLRQHPDMKTATVSVASGFSTEASFFRNFKAVTGMTPREWLTSINGQLTVI